MAGREREAGHDERPLEQGRRASDLGRETDVRNATVPAEGTDAERNATEAAPAHDERGSDLRGDQEAQPANRSAEPMPRAHVERGAHSDESLTIEPDMQGVRSEEAP